MSDQLALDVDTGTSWAVISDCGRYRYELGRRWDDGPLLEFDMLNPSTANAERNDPTIVRCVGFAKSWVDYLARDDADCTIAAWGAHAAALEWFAAGNRIVKRNLFCLGTNQGGSPKHPLYVRADTTPIRWETP